MESRPTRYLVSVTIGTSRSEIRGSDVAALKRVLNSLLKKNDEKKVRLGLQACFWRDCEALTAMAQELCRRQGRDLQVSLPPKTA